MSIKADVIAVRKPLRLCPRAIDGLRFGLPLVEFADGFCRACATACIGTEPLIALIWLDREPRRTNTAAMARHWTLAAMAPLETSLAPPRTVFSIMARTFYLRSTFNAFRPHVHDEIMANKWAYYNDNDPFVCEWARNLIRAGLVPDGEVDERSITEVCADDLKGFLQCHFFCGILGWSLALRLAGWPEDRPVWTGSCPCQPLSSAGQRKGHADERHLWPAFHDLIAERRPATILGEQVASKDGREWFSGVRADLEALGYACGAADLCAAGVGAPHIRQRLWWVADADGGGSGTKRGNDGKVRGISQAQRQPEHSPVVSGGSGTDGGVADAQDTNRRPGKRAAQEGVGPSRERRRGLGEYGPDGGVGDPGAAGLPPRERQAVVGEGRGNEGGAVVQPGCPPDGGVDESCGQRHRHGQGLHPRSREQGSAETIAVGAGPFNFWSASDLIPCGDGKARRVEPGSFPLAHGVPARVGRLRAYGNAINPWNGAEFVQAFLAAEADMRGA